MRVVLPVQLIREMDAVILEGRGGFETRAEFILDAIQERITELTVTQEEHIGRPDSSCTSPSRRGVTSWESIPSPTPGASAREALMLLTRINTPKEGYAVEVDPRCGDGGPLFGLHNTDYPSLWALARLAALAGDQPIPVETYLQKVLDDAWSFGKQLLQVEGDTGVKCTALFPTNTGKVKAASSAFKTHAIDSLYRWQVVAITSDHLIGVTQPGWHLLTCITGLTVERPHPQKVAERFLEHLADFAPGDLAAFLCLVRSIGEEGATRVDVVKTFAEAWPKWTGNHLSTNVAGYIARAREWGLVKPKQLRRTYHLTYFGLNLLKEGTSNDE